MTCKHEWERTGIEVNNGIAFAMFECEICGVKEDVHIGEILTPDDIDTSKDINDLEVLMTEFVEVNGKRKYIAYNFPKFTKNFQTFLKQKGNTKENISEFQEIFSKAYYEQNYTINHIYK